SVARKLGDGANLMLVDKEVRLAFTRETGHAVVEVLDPSRNRLAVAELDTHGYLFLAQEAQVERLLSCLTQGGRFLPLARTAGSRHGAIVKERDAVFASAASNFF